MKCLILVAIAVAAVVAASEEGVHYSDVETGPSVSLERRSVPDVPAESSVPKHSIVTRATGCSATGCNTFCRKLGHSRGVCIGSYCQCRF